MPLPLLGLALGAGKAIVGGVAKAATVGAKVAVSGAKVGAKASVSTGKFFAKGGAKVARGGVKVARQGSKQVVKGSKFFKKKVIDGGIAKRLKQNATNLRDSLKKANKNQDKLRTKKQQREEKTKSLNKKREKEKQLESKQPNARGNKLKNLLAKSPLGIFDKLFALGGLLLGGILINAVGGLIEKGKQFVKDNQELFDTIGNFFTGVKNVVVDLFNSFTGPASEEGKYDWLAKFDDSGKLTGGILLQIEKAFDSAADIINMVDKLRGGKGDIANFMYSDKGQALAMQGGKEGILDKNTGKFYEKPFTQEEQERFDRGDTSIGSAYPSAQTPSGAGTDQPINDTSASNRDDDHSVNTPQGGGNYPGFVPGRNPKTIYFHWSGGNHNGRPAPYHSFVDGAGKIHYNSPYTVDKYAHTWRRNTGSVAIAAAAMGHAGQKNGYIERKGWAENPLKHVQVNSMTLEAARLALAWGWKESDINIRNIMTHAEAAANRDGKSPTPNYGPGGEPEIRWDLWYLTQGGAKWSGGEIMRGMIKQHMRNLNRQANAGTTTQTSNAITPTEDQTQLVSTISQEDDEENVIYIQTVEKRTYIPVPVMA
tara:strand:- start:128 stop:1915 length:1788 start_codon:yes stop_codon:yes gene_type:complete